MSPKQIRVPLVHDGKGWIPDTKHPNWDMVPDSIKPVTKDGMIHAHGVHPKAEVKDVMKLRPSVEVILR